MRSVKSLALGTLGATALGLALAGTATADAEDRLDRRGDRIDRRLDQRGDRIDARLDRRSARAAEAGRDGLAAKLDRRGDRIDRRLDLKGDRIDRRLDRRGQRLDRAR